MKQTKLKVKTSFNGLEFFINFIYQDKNTVCILTDEDDIFICKGIAKLNPIDEYNQSMGEEIALEKACQSLVNMERAELKRQKTERIKNLQIVENCLKSRLAKRNRNFLKKSKK